MQALTIAIGPSGIDYFARQILAGELTQALKNLKPPDRQIRPADFGIPQQRFSKILINLSNGHLSNFSPTFQGIEQQPQGKFQVAMAATSFGEDYSWAESYHEEDEYIGPNGPVWEPYDRNNSYNYSAGIGKLAASITLSLVYNQNTQSYDIDVASTSSTPSDISPNIPGGSVINYTAAGWSYHVSDALMQSVAAVDFSGPLSAVFTPLLHSIPASGQLTPDIRYEFGRGDSGLTFPGDQGIAIGAAGRVSYKGQYYPGTPPGSLPLPPPPTDTQHLQVYVSDYEMNALHWAFFQAGLLNVTVQPTDLDDPDLLKVKTYASRITAFKPYSSYSMRAQVNPKQPPVTAFQQVYEFTDNVMKLLQQQLPADVYQGIQNSAVPGSNYLSAADLEADLGGANISQTYYQAIEKAARTMGLAVTHDLEFILTIENGQDPAPDLVFEVQRTDVLQDLGLGVSGSAQTLQYSFKSVKYTAAFVSTTIPKFDSADFGDFIWPTVGEPAYDTILEEMGGSSKVHPGGVPLPIMAGFQFLFEKAQLSIQQGYVSITAQVAFKGTTL